MDHGFFLLGEWCTPNGIRRKMLETSYQCCYETHRVARRTSDCGGFLTIGRTLRREPLVKASKTAFSASQPF